MTIASVVAVAVGTLLALVALGAITIIFLADLADRFNGTD